MNSIADYYNMLLACYNIKNQFNKKVDIISELSSIFNNLHINKIKAKISNPYR